MSDSEEFNSTGELEDRGPFYAGIPMNVMLKRIRERNHRRCNLIAESSGEWKVRAGLGWVEIARGKTAFHAVLNAYKSIASYYEQQDEKLREGMNSLLAKAIAKSSNTE